MVGMIGLSDPIYASANLPANALLDSNLRFFSGAWLGLGLAVFWLVPAIEGQTVLFRCIRGRLTFDMRGGRQTAKLAVGRPLDGRVRAHRSAPAQGWRIERTFPLT